MVSHVDPMDDPGTQDPVNAGQILAAMVQDRVDQGAGGMARSRMDHHLLCFVYDQKIFILIEDIKGNILGRTLRTSGSGNSTWMRSCKRSL